MYFNISQDSNTTKSNKIAGFKVWFDQEKKASQPEQ